MYIKDLKKTKGFKAGDDSFLKELLHPDKAQLNIHFSLAHATVKPAQKTLPHRLKTAEVYFILEGEGIMYIDDESAEVSAGQAVYIPPNTIQCIFNTGSKDLTFLCIVDPAWQQEDEEIIA